MMCTRLAGILLAIVTMACFPRTDVAGDITLVNVSSDQLFASENLSLEKPVGAVSQPADHPEAAPLPEVYVPQTCAEQCCPSCFDCKACPRYYAEVEALLFVQVPQFTNRPIIVDGNTGATFLSTSDLNSGFDPGVRTTLGCRLCDAVGVEFTYFGLFQSGSTYTVKPDISSYFIFPGNLAGNVFVNFNDVNTTYSSTLNSFELNFPCCWCCCCDDCGCGESGCGEATCGGGCSTGGCGGGRCSSFELFAGVRYFDITNGLNLAVARPENGGVETGSYDIQACDHLLGGQLGARLRRTYCRLGWELTGKAGLYGNDARQTQYVTDFPNFALRPVTTATGSNTAFVGELNLSGIYRLTDVWSLKAGYSAIWIEDLALAPGQLDFNFATSPSGDQLHAGAGLLVHGVNLGIEARW
jgi:hypothetical protein